MLGRQGKGITCVLAVVVMSALLNFAYANHEIGNSYCFSESCTAASQHCAGSGNCIYCVGGTVRGYCGYAQSQVCTAEDGEVPTCGDTFTGGACLEGTCSGGVHPEGQKCGLAKCTAIVTPPKPR